MMEKREGLTVCAGTLNCDFTCQCGHFDVRLTSCSKSTCTLIYTLSLLGTPSCHESSMVQLCVTLGAVLHHFIHPNRLQRK